MKAKDIMTSPVITAEPQTPVREIAARLLAHRISGLPVLEEGRLVGMVSEADLLHRHEIGTDRNATSSAWWLRLFSADRSIPEYIKSHASRARDIMTRDVTTVAPDTPVADIATLLEARGIKRVPVLDRGRLAGIVSRANLVQALATNAGLPEAPAGGDDAIRSRLLAELERQWWWRAVVSNVIVADGVVHYWGTLNAEEERAAARVAAESVPGVRRVEDHRFMLHAVPGSI